MCLHKCHIQEKHGPWVLSKNALSQSDCRIFKQVNIKEQLGQSAWFSTCWDKPKEVKSLHEGKRWFES